MTKFALKRKKGVTLIELLIIVVIIAIVGTAGALSFKSGHNTWGNSDKQSETIQNAVVGMEKLEREIKNSPGLTSFSDSAIRFAVLRNDGSGNYVTQYAMAKRNGDYLMYGERPTDSSNEGDWTLNNLAYPVTNLSFSFLKSDGSPAVPGTDGPDTVKSIEIKMTTADGDITIPLKSKAYLVMNSDGVVDAEHFDGTPDPDDTGEHHFDEGEKDTGGVPPPPGSKGDGAGGWSIADYAVYGDTGVIINNSGKVYGSVGTGGATYDSHNSVEVQGYLVARGTLNMNNSGAICGDSVAAAYASPSSVSFANSARANAHFWTRRNINMSNSSWIHGTVYHPSTTSIALSGSSGYDKDVTELTSSPPIPLTPPNWMEKLLPKIPAGDPDALGWDLPPGLDWTTQPFLGGLPGGVNKSYANQSDSLLAGNYGNLTLKNSSNVTILPGTFLNLSLSNSCRLNMSAGDYYFNSISISNSSRVKFDFTAGPIRIFVKTTVNLSNSSSFEYGPGSGTYYGADLLYLEAKGGLTFSNSVQWRGFIYCPNGSVSFSNSTTLAGAVYSKQQVDLSNSTVVTFVPPRYYGKNNSGNLLGSTFYRP